VGPPFLFPALRHHHYCRNTVEVKTNRPADAYLSLGQSVVAALAGAVQKQNHRPLFALVPLGRNIHLILVCDSFHAHRAVQESGFLARLQGHQQTSREKQQYE
jgi:hypothetical protein